MNMLISLLVITVPICVKVNLVQIGIYFITLNTRPKTRYLQIICRWMAVTISHELSQISLLISLVYHPCFFTFYQQKKTSLITVLLFVPATFPLLNNCRK